ncbi:MAG: prolipoprotein diacylglyceryl transferase [Anaerolineae bacterium]|jgi:prolipoprotein diacylglyceryltransferase
MLPVLQIGPLALQTAGLILVVGFWLAVEIAGRQGTQLGLDGGAIQNAGLYGALAGIVGARVAYVLEYWPVYRENLLGIVSLNPQTLSLAPGIVVGLAVTVAYLQRKEMPARPLLDAIAPGAAIFAATLALANLASGAAFGTETGVPWAIELWDARRHPVQLYEFAAALGMLAIVWRVGHRAPAPGLRFLLFVALYGGSRLMLEPLRATSQLLFGGFRAAQVGGWLVTLIALGLMPAWFREAEKQSREPAAAEETRT